MSLKYFLIPLLFILFNFSLKAQVKINEINNVESDSIQQSNSLKKNKKTLKKTKRKRKNNPQISESQTKPSTTKPSITTKPNDSKPGVSESSNTKPPISQQQKPSVSENTKEVSSKNEKPASTTPNFAILEKNNEEIVESKPNGIINWTQQYVEAKGQSVIDVDRFKNKAQANAMATRGAIVVAQRNLLEMIQGVHVVGETTVEDMITTSDYIYSRVEGFVKGAQQIGPAREVNGLIEVTLRIPIYGNKGIAGAFENVDIVNAKNKNGYKTNKKNLEFSEDESAEDIIDGSKPIVFSILGEKIDPSMFPVVIDDEGNVEFDFSELYEKKTGKFPKFVQLTKEIMNEVGYQKGVDVIELIQNGKGELKLPKDNKKRVFWQKVGNVARVLGKVLFNIAL